mmetsp:Transcript_22732/g.43477  ORF Transcript_22732/g.43477 Transcript_22732/m.43477 type:complete len:215 (-) Transcript_22732:1184-1828(-)
MLLPSGPPVRKHTTNDPTANSNYMQIELLATSSPLPQLILVVRIVFMYKVWVLRVKDRHRGPFNIIALLRELVVEKLRKLLLQLISCIFVLYRHVVKIQWLTEVDIEPRRRVQSTIDELSEKLLPFAQAQAVIAFITNALNQHHALVTLGSTQVNVIGFFSVCNGLDPVFGVTHILRRRNSVLNDSAQGERNHRRLSHTLLLMKPKLKCNPLVL